MLAGSFAAALTGYRRMLTDIGRDTPPGYVETLDLLNRVARSGQLRHIAGATADDRHVLHATVFDYKTSAYLTGLSVRTLRRRAAEGALPVVRVGRRVLIPAASILELLNPTEAA